jgi:hypothetical protein
VLSAHEGPIPCLKQELGVDERSKQRSALRRVQSPEAPRLRFSQPQTRHFQKLTLDAPKHFFIGSDGLWRHHMTSCFLIVSSETLDEQRMYQAPFSRNRPETRPVLPKGAQPPFN